MKVSSWRFKSSLGHHLGEIRLYIVLKYRIKAQRPYRDVKENSAFGMYI